MADAVTTTPEQVAQRIHETFIRLAPAFDFPMWPEDAGPWDALPDSQRRLIIAVMADVFGATPSVTEQRAARAEADTARLDWLARHVVDVRRPLRYGSERVFIDSPSDEEGDEGQPWDVRAPIDAAQRPTPTDEARHLAAVKADHAARRGQAGDGGGGA